MRRGEGSSIGGEPTTVGVQIANGVSAEAAQTVKERRMPGQRPPEANGAVVTAPGSLIVEPTMSVVTRPSQIGKLTRPGAVGPVNSERNISPRVDLPPEPDLERPVQELPAAPRVATEQAAGNAPTDLFVLHETVIAGEPHRQTAEGRQVADGIGKPPMDKDRQVAPDGEPAVVYARGEEHNQEQQADSQDHPREDHAPAGTDGSDRQGPPPPESPGVDAADDDDGREEAEQKIRATVQDNPLNRTGKNTLASQIASRIEEAARDLSPGTHLPSDDVLVEIFNLSQRKPLNSALRKLHQQGIIVRTDDGTTRLPIVDELSPLHEPEVQQLPFLQAADILEEEIRSGAYSAPDSNRLPTHKQLRERFGMGEHSVRRTIRELKRRDLVESHQGPQGTKVNETPPPRGTRVAVERERALFRDLADEYEHLIRIGDFPPGSRFLDHTSVRETNNISQYATVQLFKELRRRRLIVTVLAGRKGRQSFIVNKLPTEGSIHEPVPLYEQLANEYERRIRGGKQFPRGTPFLTGGQLGAMNNISDSTGKAVLRELEERGLIQRTDQGPVVSKQFLARGERIPLPERKSPTMELAKKIRTHIYGGTYRDRLPKNQQLQEIYGVQRSTVIGALRILAAEGLVPEQRRGRGGVRILYQRPDESSSPNE